MLEEQQVSRQLNDLNDPNQLNEHNRKADRTTKTEHFDVNRYFKSKTIKVHSIFKKGSLVI